MSYKRNLNDNYIKNHIPEDRLEQFVRDIKLDTVKEIETQADRFIFEHIQEYSCDTFEGNSDALYDLRIWLANKKVELNYEKDCLKEGTNI